jgi:hypothetical protein
LMVTKRFASSVLDRFLKRDDYDIVVEKLVINRSKPIEPMLAVNNPRGSVSVGEMQTAKLNACAFVYASHRGRVAKRAGAGTRPDSV